MGNKQLDKFAFMESFVLFAAVKCFDMRCGFDNVALGIYFLGFL